MISVRITLADDKNPETLKMALTEVARQIGEGESSGLVHGLSWEIKEGVDGDGNIVKPNSFTGGYSRFCGNCGLLLETYCPPK